MVVLSAVICTKAGRLVFARQFFEEMTRGKVEGLVSAFAKLALDASDPDKQDTTIETESVRYLFQPMEELMLVLITSKGSNILEDQDTLHTFAKVVSSYCPRLTETEVLNTFGDIAHAFDQAVTPHGHKERVTLGQIRSYVEMESHDEKVAELEAEAKKRQAQGIAKQKATELREQREKAMKMAAASGLSPSRTSMQSVQSSPMSNSSSAAGSNSVGKQQPYAEQRQQNQQQQQQQSQQQQNRSGGMQLGKKTVQKQLVDQITKEELGQRSPLSDQQQSTSTTATTTEVGQKAQQGEQEEKHESVHFVIEENVFVKALNDGTIEMIEVKGELSILASSQEAARASVVIRGHNSSYQWKTHPQIDKSHWANDSTLIASRPFPIGASIAILKWHLSGTTGSSISDSDVPLGITCWPSPAAEGMIVSMEYELRGGSDSQIDNLSLNIPIPGAEPPEVGQCDGDYNLEKGALIWRIGHIEGNKPNGSIEFSSRDASDASSFFPIDVSFSSKKCFSGLEIVSVTIDGKPATFSKNVHVHTSKYTITTTAASH